MVRQLTLGALEGAEGEALEAGRLGACEITAGPTRPDVEGALRVLLGGFDVITIENIGDFVS